MNGQILFSETIFCMDGQILFSEKNKNYHSSSAEFAQRVVVEVVLSSTHNMFLNRNMKNNV